MSSVVILSFHEWNRVVSRKSIDTNDTTSIERLEWMIEYAVNSFDSAIVLVISSSPPQSALIDWCMMLSFIYQLGLARSTRISCPLDIFPFSESLYRELNPKQTFLFGKCENPIIASTSIPDKPINFRYCFEVVLSRSMDMINSMLHALEQAPFEVVVLGGTFDHMHPGHKMLLSVASMISCRKLICGISYERGMLSNKKYSQLIQPWDVRAKAVKSFVLNFCSSLQSMEVIRLNDAYGPTLTDPDIQAIVVSKETRSGADKINASRTLIGMNPLHVIEIGLLDSFQNMDRISSTNIRASIYKRQYH